MTTEPIDDLTEYCISQVAEGRTLHDIAAELGVSHAAVWQRCTANAERQRRYWLAREAATDLLESELIEVAREGARKDAKAARVQASILQWIIEKRDPHRYGAQLRLAHSSPDGSMSPKAAVDATKLSDAALAELMAARNPEGEG